MSSFCIVFYDNPIDCNPNHLGFKFCCLSGGFAYPISFERYIGGPKQLLADLQGVSMSDLTTFRAERVFGLGDLIICFHNLVEIESLFPC